MTKLNSYDRVAQVILDALGKGTAPWRMPWRTSPQYNATTGAAYRGINIMLLNITHTANAYDSDGWMTFRQAKLAAGYKQRGKFFVWDGDGDDPKYGVRKGERGTLITFWKSYEAKPDKSLPYDDTTNKERRYVLRTYSVFNVEQLDMPDSWFDQHRDEDPAGPPTRDEAHSRADSGLVRYCDREGVVLRRGGDRACYSPGLDAINVPLLERYTDAAAWCSTNLHEAAHSTGHSSRLNRLRADGDDSFGALNSYSREELVAEICATMLCTHYEVDTSTTFDNSIAYIDGWRKRITDDPRLVTIAAARAQKACEYFLNGPRAEKED